MRKVRDYDAELKALSDKARTLKARKVEQLGSLVAATGADALDPAILAGVLLEAVGSQDAQAKAVWASKGTAFFQRRARKTGGGAGNNGTGTLENSQGQAPG